MIGPHKFVTVLVKCGVLTPFGEKLRHTIERFVMLHSKIPGLIPMSPHHWGGGGGVIKTYLVIITYHYQPQQIWVEAGETTQWGRLPDSTGYPAAEIRNKQINVGTKEFRFGVRTKPAMHLVDTDPASTQNDTVLPTTF